MQLFRFDPEVSMPITHFGSSFKIAPLTGPASRVRVQVMHLPSNGLVGRHVTPVQQLFAVVAGEGWVAGADGVRREIGPGYAALWEVGEDHEAGSEVGLTAVCVEGEFEVGATGVTRPIAVTDHEPS